MLSFCNVFEFCSYIGGGCEQLYDGCCEFVLLSITTIMSVLTSVSSYLLILYSAYNDETAVK